MGKNRRFNPDLGQGFVPLTWEMLNSKAYKTLPSSSAKALPYFLGKPSDGKKKKLTYGLPEYFNAIFHFSYSEGESYGFARATFAKAIRDLVEMGFIDPVDKGGLRGECKSFNQFQMSQRWKDYGFFNFKAKDWRSFAPRNKDNGIDIEKSSKCEQKESIKNGSTSSKCEQTG